VAQAPPERPSAFHTDLFFLAQSGGDLVQPALSYALSEASFTDTTQVREAIDAFTRAHNQQATPFEWTKSVVYQKIPKNTVSDLCN
jgi:hypothetical protein